MFEKERSLFVLQLWELEGQDQAAPSGQPLLKPKGVWHHGGSVDEKGGHRMRQRVGGWAQNCSFIAMCS